MFSPGGSQASRAIPCTLFLFDDSILVAKRTSANSSGRQLLALDDLNRLADEMKTFTERSGSSANRDRKPELGFRGVVDIADVVATDLGGPGEYQRRPCVVLIRAPMLTHLISLCQTYNSTSGGHCHISTMRSGPAGRSVNIRLCRMLRAAFQREWTR